jgi:hypothetical protein
MRKLKQLLAIVAALAATIVGANAATFDLKECKDKATGCYIVTLKGKIEPGDGDAFHNLVQSKGITNALVALNSPGGEFDDGMTIANTVRLNKFTTWVGDGWECESMCSAIWLAGSRRFYQGKAKIGFHGIYSAWVNSKTKKMTNIQPSNSGNALVGAFYNQLGLGSNAIATLTDPAPDSMYWLDKNKAVELGIQIEEDSRG